MIEPKKSWFVARWEPRQEMVDGILVNLDSEEFKYSHKSRYAKVVKLSSEGIEGLSIGDVLLVKPGVTTGHKIDQYFDYDDRYVLLNKSDVYAKVVEKNEHM